MSANPASPEALLAHAGFLHGLARSLVYGDEQADDVVQETLATALARPPRAGPGLRSWLATALRNVVRQERRARGRRLRREHVAARPESHAAEPAVAREHARRRVVDAVLRLDEPYRSTVVLRYLEDLPPREVAKRLAVPVETVRTRLRRALGRLRADLDGRHGGDRRAWCLALLPLVHGNGKAATSGLLGGALIVSTKTKIAAVVALLVLLLGAGWLVLGPGREKPGTEPERPGETPRPMAEGTGESDEHSPPGAADPVRESGGPTEPSTPDGSTVHVVFTDEVGQEIPAAEARRRFEEAGLEPWVEVVSDDALRAGGPASMVELMFGPPEAWRTRTRLLWEPTGPVLETRPSEGSWRLYLPRPGAAPYLTEAFAAAGDDVRINLRLPREPATRRILVVDGETGAPVPGATLVPFYEYGDDHAFFEGTAATADSAGFVEIPLLDRTSSRRQREPTWWAEKDGRVGMVEGLNLRQGQVSEARLYLPAEVRGRAWLSTGEAAAGYEVVWMRKGRTARTTVAADGTFVLAGVAVRGASGSSENVVLLEDLAAMKVGLAKARVRPGETAEVTIGSPSEPGGGAVVHGRVTTGGRGLAGVGVFVLRDTEVGPERRTVMTDDAGRYRMENLPAGECRVIVVPGDMRASDDFVIRTTERLRLGEKEERQISFDLPEGVVRLTVLDEETGEPLRGVVGYARPADRAAGTDRFPGFRYKPGWAAFTGVDGTVLLPAQLPGTPTTVQAFVEGYARGKGEVTPGTRDAPAEITIRIRRQE